MAKYAGQGDTALTLAEECAEVIQIITKLKRFNGNWNEVPPGQTKTRWQMLEEEMNDVLLAWERLQAESKPKPITVTIDGEHTTVTVHHNGVDTIIFQGTMGPYTQSTLTDEDIEILYEQYLRSIDPTACWDGNANHSE